MNKRVWILHDSVVYMGRATNTIKALLYDIQQEEDFGYELPLSI